MKAASRCHPARAPGSWPLGWRSAPRCYPYRARPGPAWAAARGRAPAAPDLFANGFHEGTRAFERGINQLADAGIRRLLASPFLRCVQTLEPLAVTPFVRWVVTPGAELTPEALDAIVEHIVPGRTAVP